MPFITEEIWQRIKGLAGKEGPTLMLQPWPVADQAKLDAEAEADIAWVKTFMLGVRQIRGEMNISMAKRIDVMLANASDLDRRRLADFEPLLAKLAKLESVRVLGAGGNEPLAAIALVGDMRVLVPMAGLIDKDAELARLDKEIARLQGEIQRVGGKLSNASFVDKAPPAVIDKERAKLAEAEQALTKLAEQRERIATL
jgi:valyl-tRNA synthetase